MVHNQILNEKNFILYASKCYENSSCQSTDEFLEDVRRVKYIKKLLTRYSETGELKERLILNHLIVLNNVFRPEPLCRILCLKMEHQLTLIKPFLILLNILIPYIINVKILRSIDTDLIPMDQKIVEVLRKI